jgi:hypothetical protein
MCSSDPRGSATSSQGIGGKISVMATFKSTYFLYWVINVVLKYSRNLFNCGCVYFVWLLGYLFKKHPVSTKQARV